MRALLATVAAAAAASSASAKTYLLEKFEGADPLKNWVQSSWKPEMGTWDVSRCARSRARRRRAAPD